MRRYACKTKSSTIKWFLRKNEMSIVPSSFVCRRVGLSPSVGTRSVLCADLEAVWNEAVDNGLVDTPEETASMKDEDAVFWGSVSEDVRNTPEQIYAYFVSVLFS